MGYITYSKLLLLYVLESRLYFIDSCVDFNRLFLRNTDVKIRRKEPKEALSNIEFTRLVT